jgi:uncharacterized membrane protein
VKLLDKEDWKLATMISLALGILFLAVGVFAICYFEVHRSWLGYTWLNYPFQQQGVILGILGMVLLVVAACFNERVKTKLPIPP